MAKKSKKTSIKIDPEINAVLPEKVKSDNGVAEIDPKLSFFTPKEQEKILEFINEGLPSITKVNDTLEARMHDLFIEGFNYDEIAQRLRIKKDIVLYFSYKNEWSKIKNERLKVSSENIIHKYQIAKVSSANFMSELIQMWHQYYGDQIEKYRQTKDHRIIETMDLKHLEKYFKAIELLEKMLHKENEKPPMAPTISLPEGGTVKSDGNVITVTPSHIPDQKDVGDILRALAEIKDAKEAK